MPRLSDSERYLRSMTEAQLQASVVEAAEYQGWWTWHDNDSRRNVAGWPDLWAFKGAFMLVAEFKTETGTIRPPQVETLDRIARATPYVYLIRPRHLDAALAWLAGDLNALEQARWPMTSP